MNPFLKQILLMAVAQASGILDEKNLVKNFLLNEMNLDLTEEQAEAFEDALRTRGEELAEVGLDKLGKNL